MTDTPDPTSIDPAPDRGRTGCGIWASIFVILLLVLFWWAGWGWGPSGGFWFRARPATPAPTVLPGSVVPPPSTVPAVTTQPTR